MDIKIEQNIWEEKNYINQEKNYLNNRELDRSDIIQDTNQNSNLLLCDDIIKTKICRTCKIEKLLIEFYKSEHGKFGVKGYCKICSKSYYNPTKIKLQELNMPDFIPNKTPIPIGSIPTFGGIYKIINKVNHKYYVGSSKNLYRRWKKHRAALYRNGHKNNHLQNAWNKYGSDSFEFIVIELLPRHDIRVVEQIYLNISKLESDRCYNMKFSVTGGDLSLESRKKISDFHKGKPKSNEHRLKLSEFRRTCVGWKHSEESKIKMSKSRIKWCFRNKLNTSSF